MTVNSVIVAMESHPFTDSGVAASKFFDNWEVGVTGEDACELPRVLCELDFVVEGRVDWDASPLRCPEVVFAVAWREVHDACGGFDIDEVFADDFVH